MGKSLCLRTREETYVFDSRRTDVLQGVLGGREGPVGVVEKVKVAKSGWT